MGHFATMPEGKSLECSLWLDLSSTTLVSAPRSEALPARPTLQGQFRSATSCFEP